MPWLIKQGNFFTHSKICWKDWITEYDPQGELVQIAKTYTTLPVKNTWEEIIASVPLVPVQDRLRRAELAYQKLHEDEPRNCPPSPINMWTFETADKLILIVDWCEKKYNRMDIHIRDQRGWLTIILQPATYMAYSHREISRTILDGLPGRYKAINIRAYTIVGDVIRIKDVLTVPLYPDSVQIRGKTSGYGYLKETVSPNFLVINLQEQSLVLIPGQRKEEQLFMDQEDCYISYPLKLLEKLRNYEESRSVSVSVWKKEAFETVDIIEDCL